MNHFESFDSGLQSLLVNHMVGLLHWANTERKDLLESPHNLLNYYLRHAVLPSQFRFFVGDLNFISSCHRFLEDYARKINDFPVDKKYFPRFAGETTYLTSSQRKFLESLIQELPEDHPAKKLDLEHLNKKEAGAWIDRLKRERRRSA